MNNFSDFNPPEYISIIETMADLFSDTLILKKLKVDKEFSIVCKKKFKVDFTELKGGIKIPVKNREELRGIDPGSKIYNEFFSTYGHSIEKVHGVMFTAGYLSNAGYHDKYIEKSQGILAKYGLGVKRFMEHDITEFELKKIYIKAYTTFLETAYRDGGIYNYERFNSGFTANLDGWLNELQESFEGADFTVSRYEDENHTIENYLKNK